MNNLKRAEAYHKSRLGRILLNRGYVDEEQLTKAISVQKQKGGLLGEVLLAMKGISRFQLQRALSNQTRIRFASSLAMCLLQPVQEMAETREDDAMTQSADQLNRILEPVNNSLTTADGFQALEYDPNEAKAEICVDGSVRLKVPTNLGELRFDGLRIKGTAPQSYEELEIGDIDLSNTRLSVRAAYKG